jgi:thiol-disulfide isomerase/thioredoxin
MTIRFHLPKNSRYIPLKTIFTAIATTILLSAGCGEGSPVTSRDAGPPPQALGSTGAWPTRGDGTGRLRGLPAPLRFDGTTLDGRPFKGADLAERPVVFWFWAPWCPICISEAPHVAEVARKYGDRVTFVGVAGFETDRDKMRRFVVRTGTGGITQLDDHTGRLYAHFKVTTVPSYLFVTAGGKSTRDFGQLQRSAWDGKVRKLAGAPRLPR